MIVDCCMYMYILVQIVDSTHVSFLSCMYMVYYKVLQLIIYGTKDENSTAIDNTLCHSPSPSSAVVDCYI